MKTIVKTNSIKYLIFITLFCVGCIFFASCKRENCPGFPEQLADYFPHKNGDTLMYVNQNSDTISFIVRETYKVEESYIDNMGCQKCACGQPFISFRAYLGRASMKGYLSSGYNNYNPRISFYLDYEYLDKDSYGQTKHCYLVKEKGSEKTFFSETIVISDYNQQIVSVILEKGKGFVEFYDKKNNFHWKRIK